MITDETIYNNSLTNIYKTHKQITTCKNHLQKQYKQIHNNQKSRKPKTNKKQITAIRH